MSTLAIGAAVGPRTDDPPRVVDIINLSSSAHTLLRHRVLAARAAGFDNRIICKDGRHVSGLRAAGIPVHTVHMPRGLDPLRIMLATLEITYYLRRHRVQLVHTHCSIPGAVGRVAAWLAGVPVIIHTVHGFHPRAGMPWPLRKFYLAVERTCGLVTDTLLTQNHEDLELANRHRIGPAGRRRAIGNGIDLERFRSVPRSKQAGDPVTIACVARLEPVKNHAMLFESLVLLKRRRADFRVWLVGDGPLRARYQRLCARLGIDDVVEFLGYRDDIPELLAQTDIVVLTSIKEGIPRAAMEAMAMGLPVVATRVPGTREVVRHFESGLTVGLGDVATLTAALSHLIADPTARAMLGARAQAMATEAFDERQVVRSLLGIYRARLRDRGALRPPTFAGAHDGAYGTLSDAGH